ncbi:MAG: immunoglobulin domain-containing protein [Bacteroidales bacterium]|nr:immunoglobulin domain-containing protein [Bacteroidales bacterium]
MPISSGNCTIDNNVIGHTTQPNSIVNDGQWGLIGIRSESSGNIVISNNTLANISSISGLWNAKTIGIYNNSGTCTIIKNTVYNISAASNNGSSTEIKIDGPVAGIVNNSIYSNAKQIISQNNVYNIISTISGSYDATLYGIISTGTETSSTQHLVERNIISSIYGGTNNPKVKIIGLDIESTNTDVINNMICLGINADGSQVNSPVTITGIYNSFNNPNLSTNHNVFFNSVFIGASQVTSGTNNTYCFQSTYNQSTVKSTFNLNNNIFVNMRSNISGTAKHYCLAFIKYTFIKSDYNLFNTAGSSDGGYIGNINGADYNNILSWQGTNFDNNSIAGNPNFINTASANPDLHLQTPSPASGKAISTGIVNIDIDGDPRPAKPAIGADEINNCTAVIKLFAEVGAPAYGTEHYIALKWEKAAKASKYLLEYSENNKDWIKAYEGTDSSYSHNCADKPNSPFYYRVSTYIADAWCDPALCSTYPIYTACDLPDININNPTNYTLSITFNSESPVVNPDYTLYSIYCITTGNYVQADGSTGADEIFKTKAQWGVITVIKLNKNTEYCFYAKAQNKDGYLSYKFNKKSAFDNNDNFLIDIPEITIIKESFDTNPPIKYDNETNTDNDWLANDGANISNGGYFKYFGSSGISGATSYKYLTGMQSCVHHPFNENFLRTPILNLTGATTIKMSFKIPIRYENANEYLHFKLKLADETLVEPKPGSTNYIYMNGSWSDGNSFNIEWDLGKNTDIQKSASYIYIYMTSTNDVWNQGGGCLLLGIDDIEIIKKSTTPSICVTTTNCTEPEIITQPVGIKECEGKSVVMGFKTSGDIETYQWQQKTDNWNNISDNDIFAGSATNKLTINNITDMDNNQFRCLVTGCNTSLTSEIVLLTVLKKPIILEQPKNASICETIESFRFNISVQKSDNQTFQWQKDGQNIDNAKDSVYTMFSPTPDKNGAYQCIITNNCGSVTSQQATLTVETAPELTYVTNSQTRCENDSVSFKVIVKGNNILYQWRKDNINITNATNSSLVLYSVKTGDIGAYSCFIQNDCGNLLASSGYLSVNPDFSFSVSPLNPSKCEGDSILFKTKISGATAISYNWKKGEIQIPDAYNSSLMIMNLSKIKDENLYTCTVNTICGSKSTSTTLLIKTKPVYNPIPITQTKEPGDSVLYTVSPSGSDNFTFQWLKNGNIISDKTNSDLKLNNLSKSDAGVYSCVITNNCGSNTFEIATLNIAVETAYTLDGFITYYNSKAAPINKSKVYLVDEKGLNVDTTETDNTGYYKFEKVVKGNYTINLSITMKWSGCNPVDALYINRHFLGLYKIPAGLLQSAADVKKDNKINPLDALFINRRFIGLLPKFDIKDWLYEQNIISVNSDTTYNIKAICAGDVNASYPQK